MSILDYFLVWIAIQMFICGIAYGDVEHGRVHGKVETILSSPAWWWSFMCGIFPLLVLMDLLDKLSRKDRQ